MRVGRAHLVLAPPKIFSAEEPALRMLEIVDYECRPGVSPRAVGSLCYVIASERWSAAGGPRREDPSLRAAHHRVKVFGDAPLGVGLDRAGYF